MQKGHPYCAQHTKLCLGEGHRIRASRHARPGAAGAAMTRERVLHYVIYPLIPDWLACGWQVVIPNGSMHHHHYGVVMEWLCDCKMARPK